MNEQASSWLSAIDGLPAVHARLQRVVILNKPAVEVIHEQDGPDTLFYLEPPYPGHTRTAQKVYRHEMSFNDHKELLRVVLACQGKLMLSSYRTPLYDINLRHWRKVTREIPNHAAGGKEKRKMTEYLWMNY
jgi:DNA adenine methylase